MGNKPECKPLVLKIDRLVLERESERASCGRQRDRERENPQSDSPLSVELDLGLDPTFLRS